MSTRFPQIVSVTLTVVAMLACVKLYVNVEGAKQDGNEKVASLKEEAARLRGEHYAVTKQHVALKTKHALMREERDAVTKELNVVRDQRNAVMEELNAVTKEPNVGRKHFRKELPSSLGSAIEELQGR